MKVDISENLYRRIWSLVARLDKEQERAVEAGIHQGATVERPLRQQKVADSLLGESGHILREIKELVRKGHEEEQA